jgi:hypothetical protein
MLATDLSSRGDRALDRAIQLANTWQPELLIVYALEAEGSPLPDCHWFPSWQLPADSAAFVERQLRDDIGDSCSRFRFRLKKANPCRSFSTQSSESKPTSWCSESHGNESGAEDRNCGATANNHL